MKSAVVSEPDPPTQITSHHDKMENNCSGNARCFSGKVTSVIDGDTIRVNDHSVRLALSSAPELNGPSWTKGSNLSGHHMSSRIPSTDR